MVKLGRSTYYYNLTTEGKEKTKPKGGKPKGYSVDNNNKKICDEQIKEFIIDTIDGAKASAIIYSIAETAKANNLKPYNYFELLLTEIPRHMRDTNLDFLDNLLPWSEKLPVECKKQNK